MTSGTAVCVVLWCDRVDVHGRENENACANGDVAAGFVEVGEVHGETAEDEAKVQPHSAEDGCEAAEGAGPCLRVHQELDSLLSKKYILFILFFINFES